MNLMLSSNPNPEKNKVTIEPRDIPAYQIRRAPTGATARLGGVQMNSDGNQKMCLLHARLRRGIKRFSIFLVDFLFPPSIYSTFGERHELQEHGTEMRKPQKQDQN